MIAFFDFMGCVFSALLLILFVVIIGLLLIFGVLFTYYSLLKIKSMKNDSVKGGE